MKSFFKSLKKKREGPPSAPSSPFTCKSSVSYSDHSESSSASSSSSSVSTIHVPVVRLEMSHSPHCSSGDNFLSPMDDPFACSKPSRAPPAPAPDQRFLSPRHPYSDIHRVAIPPPLPPNNIPRSTRNAGHGPPRNWRHGPPNILQAQMASINANSSRVGHYSLREQTTESLSQQKARTIRFEASPLPVPREAKAPPSRGRIPTEQQDHQGVGFLHNMQREGPSPSNGEPRSGAHMNPGSPKGLKVYHASQSSPHLPQDSPIDSQDLSSLFPSPPPLIIRKRVPQPLVLQPRRPSTGSTVPSSPDPSSTESTPVSTPTSPKFSPPTQSPLSKSFARHANGIPPLLYDPPTSPLPSPPVSLQSKARQSSVPFQGRVHLRGAQSTNNLRSNAPFSANSQTHRMTSSDPVAEFLQELGLDDRLSSLPSQSKLDQVVNSQFSKTSRDAPVNWGYAI
ncbi:hypothetical protein BKA70DRAFT_1419972 [Coprinopsis sp. MPI-PUGE-AT-0042]|nr:hypothetical protein BKA70DRAFT_1419972 [Coprinopsis sp. MPI-PUGE-AT-0042]